MTRLAFLLAAFVSMALAADSALLALIPADAKVVGGMNVDRALPSPFGQFLLTKIKEEEASFQKFISATGFDPRLHLREVIFAGTTPGSQSILGW